MRSYKTKIRSLTKSQFQRLRVLSQHSKNLYNQALWILKQGFELTGKHYPYQQMDKVMKQVENLEGTINYKLLKAKVSQQTLRKLDTNFKSFFKAFKDYKKNPNKYKACPKPPKFKKNIQYNLVYDYQAFKVKCKLILVDKPILHYNHAYPICCMLEYKQVAMLEKGLEIKLPTDLWNKHIQQIEIIPKLHFFEAVFSYQEDVSELEQIESNSNTMAIDLGINNLATCVTNGVIPPFIVDGKRLKYINAKYNKNKAKHQSKLEQRGKKWSRRLQRLADKRNRAVNDYIHKASAIIVNNCVAHKISKVCIGDLSKALHKVNLGKKNNQNFMFLALGQFVKQLDYKLGVHNIELCVIDESYTSKASFIDNDVIPKQYKADQQYEFVGKRVKRGWYKSQNGTVINADSNGAFNILRKADSTFNFSDLIEKVGNKVSQWLHPTKRFMPLPTKKQQFWIDSKRKFIQIQVT